MNLPFLKLRLLKPAALTAALFGSVLVAPFAMAQPTFAPIDPSLSGSFLAGREASSIRDLENAATFYLDALAQDHDNPVLMERAFHSFVSAGNIPEAKRLASGLIELEDRNELALFVLGIAALKERRYSSVDKYLSELEPASIVGISGALVRAWSDVGQGNIESARVNLQDANANGFEDFVGFHRGLMEEVSGNRDDGRKFLKTAYERDKKVVRIVEAYARSLANDGQYRAATRILKKFERDVATHPKLVQLQIIIDKKTRPGLLAENAQQGVSEMLHGIGTALGRDDSIDLAIMYLRLGLFLTPKSDLTAMVLSEQLERLGQYEEANSIYNRMPLNSPMQTEASIRVSRNLTSLDENKAALTRIAAITNSDPTNLTAIRQHGIVLRILERYADAAEIYGNGIDTIKKVERLHWPLFYARGIAYERDGQWDLAEKDFLAALDLFPDQPSVLNYLGYSWVEKGDNLEVALDMIERAVGLRPGDGFIIDSLGWAYYQLGRFEEAVTELERAVLLLPVDPTLHDHLGDAYWKAGRQLEARYQWSHTRDLEADDDLMIEVIAKLDIGLDAYELAEKASS